MMKKCVIYCRVSSERQLREGFSIAAQQHLLREYAQQKQYKVVQEFYDDESAGKIGRTAFGEMVVFLKANKPDVTTILVEKTDRLYRNQKDWVIIDDLQAHVCLVKEGTVLGPDATCDQKFVHGMNVLIAKRFLDNLSEEVRKGHAAKVRAGLYPSNPMFGYASARIEGKHILVPHPLEAEIVRRMFSLYATGHYSLRSMLEQIMAEGLFAGTSSAMNLSTAQKILTNPVYYGVFRWHGELHQGVHEPLVSQGLWQQVQTVQQKFLTHGSMKYAHVHQFFLKGLLKCGECGRNLTAERKKGKYVYYRCTRFKRNCTQKCVAETVLTKQIDTLFAELYFPEDLAEYMKLALQQSRDSKNVFEQEQRKALETERQQLTHKLDKLYDYLMSGTIDAETYKAKKSDYISTLAKVNENITSFDKANADHYETGVLLIELARNASKLYKRSTQSEKHHLLELLVSNFTVKDKKLHPNVNKPFDILLCNGEFPSWQGQGESNPRCQDENLAS